MGNYNFITPYSHGLTHGLLFGLLCLASIFRGLESGRASWWLLAGASAALAVGSKPEAGVAALLTLASGVAAGRRIRPERSSSSLYAVVGFILVLGLIASLVGRMPGVSPAIVLEPYRSAMSVASIDVPFYRRSGGVESAFVQAVTGILTAVILALAILWPGRRRDSTGRARDVPHPGQVLLWRVAVAVTLFVLFNVLFPYAWLKLARALPWISAAALLTCLWTLVSTSTCPVSERQRTIATEVALLSVFASTLLLKTGLDARFFHYGFALSAPATLLAIGLFGHSLPARARLKGISALRARVVAPAVVLFLVLSAASQSAAFYSRRTVPLEYGSDLLFITSAEFDPRTPTILRLLRELADSGPFHDGAVVLPEGPMFHYMLRAPSAVPVASLMPLEIQLVGPQRVLGMVQEANPPLVVVVEPDLKLWRTLGGPDGHPYELLREWIKLHYCEKERFGNDRSDVYRLEVVLLETCVSRSDSCVGSAGNGC